MTFFWKKANPTAPSAIPQQSFQRTVSSQSSLGPEEGYYQFPTLSGDHVVFVSEGDLWRVSTAGGTAEKLTGDLGSVYDPYFSPDGRLIAFTGTQEGHRDVYVTDANGGLPRRLTFYDHGTSVLGWTPEGRIVFKSNFETPFPQIHHLYTLSPSGGEPQKLPTGAANDVAFGPGGRLVIQRHGYGYVSWKKYRGGTAGELWINTSATGEFEKLLSLDSNTLSPLWIRDRIYFLSDHEGHGQIYSCTEGGEDLRAHTDAKDFYVRQISRGSGPQDTRIVYKEGADLRILETQTGEITDLTIRYPSARPHKARVFARGFQNLTAYDLDPEGNTLLLTSRGRLFSLNPFRGPVVQQGVRHGVRYRLGHWLTKDQSVAVRDLGDQEVIDIFGNGGALQETLSGLDWGRILELKPSPKGSALLLTNHRHELVHVDLKTHKILTLDHSPFGPFDGMDWSPDGRFVVYSIRLSHTIQIVRLVNIQTLEKIDLTTPLAKDTQPCFDPDGKYVYFLSFRTFTPAKDPLKFDWAFEDGVRPYLIPLQKETLSPFLTPKDGEEEETEDGDKKRARKKEGAEDAPLLSIDFEGIRDRIVPFPVPAGDYKDLRCTRGKVFWTLGDPGPSLPDEDEEDTKPEAHSLQMYDMQALKLDHLAAGVTSLSLCQNGGWIAYTTPDKRLRVIKSGEKPDEHDLSYRAGGWVEESRVRIEVMPLDEWRFMFDEAWRLQRDLFWREDMGALDWQAIHRRHRPLVERAGTLAELMDIVADMQGELGCSHAYTWGFSEGHGVPYTLGQLGATFKFEPSQGAWVLHSFSRGSVGDPDHGSPLLRPGLNLKPGTRLWSIDGTPVSIEFSPAQALVHKAGVEVALCVSDPEGDTRRTVWVRTLSHTSSLRYRDWVENNRAYVHNKTGGKLGYIHIPDMVEHGFSEFFQSYLQEFDRDGLVIDIRFNNGGQISSLLLSVLSRKRLGFDQTRWEGRVSYLTESPRGPMVALCNETTGSDGDMFAYSFQRLGLGPLIGKRTWGGVIGIFPRHPLLDGTMTSQPEYAIWFHDIGWTLENRGAEPDILIENTPQEDARGLDRPLDRAIEEALKQIQRTPS